ncbi:peptidoglycan-binding domain-containing protein [Azospirillum sp. ST 5-10]|uniref:peptidoglycan-binding domain-containing protein n=1 Tax=unclassified Azospirillum TaxID=2630922 RepID=UPI003F4A520E
MRKIPMMVAASGLALALAACGNTTEQRSATGGAGGAVAGALVGGPVGAVVGGVGGAAASSQLDEPIDEKVGELTDDSARSGSTGGRTTASASSSGMSAGEIRQVQQALNERGYSLAVDGVWGPNTRDAVRRFQRTNGMEATGRVDRQTMAALQTNGGNAGQQPTSGSSATGNSGATGNTGPAGGMNQDQQNQ